MASVIYSKTVSDENVKKILKAIADTLVKNVTVHSGDRSAVPTGGSTTSHHLLNQAADFHVVDLTDAVAYTKLKEKKSSIFDTDQSYQVIHHGAHTDTGGQHLHIGRWVNKKTFWIKWTTEGLTETTKGVYTSTTENAPT